MVYHQLSNINMHAFMFDLSSCRLSTTTLSTLSNKVSALRFALFATILFHKMATLFPLVNPHWSALDSQSPLLLRNLCQSQWRLLAYHVSLTGDQLA